MEQIIFLVIVAGIGLLRLLAQAAEKKRNAEAQKQPAPRSETAVPRSAPQSEEERVRKFFEALGVPPTSAPPQRPSQKRTVTPKTPPRRPKVMPVDPFPVPRTTTWDRPVVITPTVTPPLIASASPLPTRETTVLAGPARRVLSAADFEISRLGEETASAATNLLPGAPGSPSSPASWAVRLARSGTLRDAIVLREIFGPPRSLQSEIR